MSIFGPCTALLTDPKNPQEIEEWCREQPDFVGVIVTDVSDLSINAVYIYSYGFQTVETTNWFKLRWM